MPAFNFLEQCYLAYCATQANQRVLLPHDYAYADTNTSFMPVAWSECMLPSSASYTPTGCCHGEFDLFTLQGTMHIEQRVSTCIDFNCNGHRYHWMFAPVLTLEANFNELGRVLHALVCDHEVYLDVTVRQRIRTIFMMQYVAGWYRDERTAQSKTRQHLQMIARQSHAGSWHDGAMLVQKLLNCIVINMVSMNVMPDHALIHIQLTPKCQSIRMSIGSDPEFGLIYHLSPADNPTALYSFPAMLKREDDLLQHMLIALVQFGTFR